MPNDAQAQDADIERQRLTSLINSMTDGVIAIDQKLKIVLTNGGALNILDSNTSVIGISITRVMKLIDKNNQPIDLRRVILDSHTAVSSRDWRLQYPDGSTISLYASIAPVRVGYGKDGDSHGYVLILRDITHEKSLEEERDEFISVVSHELRTPIAITEGNIGNAEFLLERTGDISKVKDALRQAHEQTTFLAGLINDLSTLSRAERGKLAVDVESINAHDLIAEIAKNYTPDATKKGLKIVTEIDPSLEVLQSSRLYVREILQNFLTNAIKYTEEGHVTLSAKPTKAGVVFRVSDTGIGISKADQEKVFDKFFRSEDYRTRQNNGTGLGLYVTMKLARLIHAEIELESKLDKGSTFSIYIPNLK